MNNNTQIDLEKEVVKIALDVFERTRKKVEFEEFGTDYIFIPDTISSYLVVSSLHDKLSSEQREIIQEFDLYGLLHLSFITAREPTNVKQAYAEKSIINSFFQNLAPNIVQGDAVISIANIKSELKQLRENTQVQVSIKNQLDVAIGNTEVSYIGIIDKIITEIDVYITRLLDQVNFSGLLAKVIKATDFANEILTGSLQDYEDIWIAARAEEQNREEHFNFVDEMNIIGFTFPPEFSKLSEIKQSVLRADIFSPNIKVLPSKKNKIKNDIELLLNFINGDSTILDLLLKGLSEFSERNIESIANFFSILRENKQTLILRYLGNNFIIDAEKLKSDSPSIQELINFINTFDHQDADKYSKLLTIIDNIVSELSISDNKEYRYLCKTLSGLKEAFLYLMVNLIDVLDDKSNPKAFFNLFFKLENLNSFLDLFYGNLDDIFLFLNKTLSLPINIDSSTEVVCNRIEDNARAKIRILTNFIDNGEQKYLEFRRERNEELNDIISRSYNLIDTPTDHKGYLANIYAILLEESNEDLSDTDIENLYGLSVLTQSQILAKLKAIYPKVLETYANILKNFMKSGRNNQRKILENQELNEEDMSKFSNYKNLIATFQFLGFYPVVEKEYSLNSKVKESIFESYLHGWE